MYYVFGHKHSELLIFILDPKLLDSEMLHLKIPFENLCSFRLSPLEPGSFYLIGKNSSVKVEYKINRTKGAADLQFEVKDSRYFSRNRVFSFTGKRNTFWEITSESLVLKSNGSCSRVFKHGFDMSEIEKVESFEVQTGNSPQFSLM